MNKTPKYWNKRIKEGKNISQLMRKELNEENNSEDIIEMAYELQSGSYIEAYKNNKELYEHKLKYSKKITELIKQLCKAETVLEAGVGEATTLINVIKNISSKVTFYGFDISLSRLLYAKDFLESYNIDNFKFCTGDLINIPFLDNSIDIVYTSHSIEPNRGKEEEILKELYRVTNKYLILLEPAYELTNEENRKRMDTHRYCKNLFETAKKLKYNIIKYEAFPFSANLNNPTSLIIIEKNMDNKFDKDSVFSCPLYKTELFEQNDCYYSDEAMSLYPKINDIACLRKQNRILATKYQEIKKS